MSLSLLFAFFSQKPWLAFKLTNLKKKKEKKIKQKTCGMKYL